MKKLIIALLFVALPAQATTFTGTNNTPSAPVVKVANETLPGAVQFLVQNVVYMRAKGHSGSFVFWKSFGVDGSAVQYTGGDTPVSDVVVIKKTTVYAAKRPTNFGAKAQVVYRPIPPESKVVQVKPKSKPQPTKKIMLKRRKAR